MYAAVGGLPLVRQPFDGPSLSAAAPKTVPSSCQLLPLRIKARSFLRIACVAKPAASGGSGVEKEEAPREEKSGDVDSRQLRRSADWRAARAYKDSGVLFDGKIEAFNNGGLIIRFYSLTGFLPFPLLSPYHSCKDPSRAIQDVAKDLVGSTIYVKVTEAIEEEKKLIFSEKDASWSKYSSQIKVGDVFDGMVGSFEDYGAFVHLRFPDGNYNLTGLVHVTEVSWDLVQDVRDFLNEGDMVKVKIIHIDREKSRISLSIKQLEDDPLMETLDKVNFQDGELVSDRLNMSLTTNIEPLPGLESICKELLQEDGITEVRLGRQGLEKRVVSQDLQLWLSNAPAKDKHFTLLARAGRQVQEVYLTTTLDQDGIKKAVQRVLGRVP
ncbi:30S ribosomal protein S1 homolog [Zingiber officinale]|uniref:30S ribosomal protein S1 homolog n=1 Tax=Zingiber officinale TaxID=94328 RepID=UPI001C4CBF9F|nr:30S ribosomal protein S1 homolog [Zingiber officinale]